MPAECNQKDFGFHPLRQREIRAQLDCRALTTVGGGLLLRENQHNANVSPCEPLEFYSVDQSKTSPRLPFVSVVMPVRNHADSFLRSLSPVFTRPPPPDSLTTIV